jgi:hypothetical protein
MSVVLLRSVKAFGGCTEGGSMSVGCANARLFASEDGVDFAEAGKRGLGGGSGLRGKVADVAVNVGWGGMATGVPAAGVVAGEEAGGGPGDGGGDEEVVHW